MSPRLSALPSKHGRKTPLLTARDPLAQAERFVWLTARVLEQRRFAYHFLRGGADQVETALAAYLDEDGGYGHALEPDLRGPVSQPLHTAHGLRVLDSIGRCGGLRVERICRYLTDVSTHDGALPAIHPSQRGYPSAPFVPVVDSPPSALLTTGPVVGVLHRNQVWHAWLFRATEFCWSAVESLETSHPYEIEAAVAFLDGAPDRSRAETAAYRLGCLVRDQRLAVLDPDKEGTTPLRRGTRPGSSTSRTTTRACRTRWLPAGSRTRRWPVPSTGSRPTSRRTAAGRSAGAPGPPAPPWSGGRS